MSATEATPLADKKPDVVADVEAGASATPDAESSTMAWAVLAMSSTVIILATVMGGGFAYTFNAAYTVTAGAVGLVLALVALGLIYSAPETMSRQIISKPAPVLGEVTVATALGLFSFVWWSIATGIITFQGPFVVASNGYFAAWIGWWSSVVATGYDPRKAYDAAHRRGIYAELLFAATVLLLALIPTMPAHTGNPAMPIYATPTAQQIYGIILAPLTIVLCIIVLVAGKDGSQIKDLSASPIVFGVLSALWVGAAIGLTFQAPFQLITNGYFACWFGAIVCVLALVSSRRK